MSARSRQAALAVWLAAVAGFVDAVGYLVLHREFVAHMTGNTSELAQQLGRGRFDAALPLAVAVLVFVGSIALATVALELATRRRLRSPVAAALAIEAVLIAVFMVYGSSVVHRGSIPGRAGGFYVCATAAVAAMGIQTATVTRWGSQTIRSTYLSGMLTRLGQSGAVLIVGERDGAPSYVHDRLGFGSRRETLLRAGVYLSLWLAFVGAGALGAWTLSRFELWSLAIPLGALVLAAAATARRPIQGEGA